MSYIEKNKEAWEEAFDNRINGWGDAVVENLRHHPLITFSPRYRLSLIN